MQGMDNAEPAPDLHAGGEEVADRAFAARLRQARALGTSCDKAYAKWLGEIDAMADLVCSYAGGNGWYAILTSIRRQALAMGSIAELGFKVFAPIRTVMAVQRGRRVKVPRYPFGRYIFAEFDINRDEKWPEINRANGVEYLICTAASGRGNFIKHPIRIPERQMAKVFKWMDHPDITAAAKVGDIMRVISGPFAGHPTTLTAVYEDRYNAVGDVELFNRMVSFTFDLDQLEKA